MSANDRQVGVLALLAQEATMTPLLAGLAAHGIAVDVARDAAEARAAFFASGGHDCLVVAPDVRPGLARAVAATLRTVDPALSLASFGPTLSAPERGTREARLAAYHPGSRAGLGALLRFLRGMSR